MSQVSGLSGRHGENVQFLSVHIFATNTLNRNVPTGHITIFRRTVGSIAVLNKPFHTHVNLLNDVQNVGFVAVSGHVEVHCGMGKAEGEPGVDGEDGDDPEDPHHLWQGGEGQEGRRERAGEREQEGRRAGERVRAGVRADVREGVRAGVRADVRAGVS